MAEAFEVGNLPEPPRGAGRQPGDQYDLGSTMSELRATTSG